MSLLQQASEPKSSDWCLVSANTLDCGLLMQQFHSLTEVTDWGGEGFRYPLRRIEFLQQLYVADSQSFYLMHQQHAVGFGQLCQRFQKHHFARLLIFEEFRGRGWSKVLLIKLMQHAMKSDQTRDFSLFVFKHNAIARQCYLSCGFQPAPQPSHPHPGLEFMLLPQQRARQFIDHYSF